MKKVIILLLFVFMALGLSAQTPINTQTGIVPVHNLRVEDTTYFGQLIGIWAIDAGDTMFGFVPVYVLPDSTLLVGSDTVYSSGNPQVITLSGDVTGSGTSSIVTNIAAGAVGATELQTGAVTTVKIAASAVDSTKIGANAVGPSELQSTAVSPGSYTLSSVTVDADGRLTAASNGTVNLASQVTGTLPVANGGTGVTSLPGGLLPAGTANQTLRHNGTAWIANSLLTNDGAGIGIGTTYTGRRFTVQGDGTNLTSFQLANNGWTSGVTGTVLTMGHGAHTGDTHSYIRTGTGGGGSFGNIALVDLGGNVGIGTTSIAQRLHVTGNIFSDGTNAQFLGDDAVNAVTSPTYSFSGDTDNGMYRPAADNIGLVTNGVEKVRITSTGNVGINTTAPGASLLTIKNTQEPVRTTIVATQGFAADTTNWTRGAGWVFNGTQAVATAATGNLTYTPTITVTSGNAYEVTYTMSGYTSGVSTLAFGNATYVLPSHNATANVVVVLPTSGTGGLRFTTSNFTGILDNISVIEVSSPAPVLISGQDDGSNTLYSSVRMPNSNTYSVGGGASFTTGTFNAFIGENAGLRNTTGRSNNFFGGNTGLSNTIGFSNNFFGGSAGASNTTGNYNNFFGEAAGQYNTTGGGNNFFGLNAGANNRTGANNNFFGLNSGNANTTGIQNNFFGEAAGAGNTTGNHNVFHGFESGRSNTTGSQNIAIGRQAGYNPSISTVGNNNILIGSYSADNIVSSASGNVVIGNQLDLPVSNDNNQLVISNLIFGTKASGTGTTIPAEGKVGIKINAPERDLHIQGEARIADLTTDTPTRIVGADADGDLGAITLGSGLSITSGTLNTTNNGTVTSIATSAPLTGGPITSTGTIGITQANSTTNGFLSSTDWNTFNNKLSAEVDGSTTNELQNLSLTGQSLGISSGTGVTLPIIDVAAGTGVTVSKTGGVATVTNSAPDQTVTLTGAGINSITGTYPNFTITGTEVDGSTTNELQNLSLTGQSLGISSGSGVTLPIIDVAAGTGVTVSKTGGVATVSATSTGTVSSVGLTMPTGFTVSNSPVTTSGTLAVTTTLNGPLRGNGSGFTTGNTNLASEVTGTLPVANGGTGVTTLTANKVLVGNGTSTVLSPTNLHWDNTDSRLGISETSPAYPLDINANTAMRLPRGLDTNQPAAAAGLLRFSTTTNTVDWSDGSNWYKGISGEGQGPSSNFNRVALWSGASTQTSDADLTFNPSTGQLKMLKYTGASTFTGTSVAELHVTSTGEVITKSPRDTQYVHLVAVTPGTAVTQTAGHDFYQGSFLMPEHLDNYTLSRADYAISNSTATTGSLTVRIRYYDTTNGGGSTACAVTFSGADVRESSTNGLVMPKGYWMHPEVGSTNGTLNNTVEGLLVTLMFTK